MRAVRDRHCTLTMKSPLHTVALVALLAPVLAAPAPLIGRDNEPAASVLKPETVQAIEAILVSSNIPGMSIAVTTKDQDQILNFGNATIAGQPVTDDVSVDVPLVDQIPDG